MTNSCDIKNCNCIGDWTPMLVLTPFYDGVKFDAVEISFKNLYVCSAHKKTMVADDLMNDEIWKTFNDQIKEDGKNKPDRVTINIEFEQIEDKSIRVLH